ncbi:MAG: antitoxin [Candidatus Competibacteraceae bacterium]|nr:antitoxin [Candidatus Competibacteraceae bacterium]MBK8752096.1 antitoxin [Candidatus Competibacteraceae bacterium]
MERINVTQASRQFSDLLNRVFYQGVSFELKRGNRVIAKLCPASAPCKVAVRDLNRLFAELPRLNEGAESFAQDIDAIRKAALPEQDS